MLLAIWVYALSLQKAVGKTNLLGVEEVVAEQIV
jgi:hypothetical protein